MNTFLQTTSSFYSRFSRLVLVVVLAGLSGSVLAQAPLKIAILDMNAALFNSEVAKQVDQKVRAETSEDEQKVRSLAAEATALQEKLQKDGSVMSDDEKRSSSEKIEEIGVQYQFLVQKLQKLTQERRQQFQQTYAPNLIQAITEIVEQENYDIVFRAEATVHFTPAIDITARVTEKLNQIK